MGVARSLLGLAIALACLGFGADRHFWGLPTEAAGDEPKLPRPQEVSGIENVWRIGVDLYSGGDPGGSDGLKRLREMGVRSIVSVDGAEPAVEAARALGLRYVHIPVGYDGIDESARVLLARSMSELPRPIYVHCHHGKHRGPAAAAIMARVGLDWGAQAAIDFIKMAGTSADYPGLYAAVRFDPKSVVPPKNATLKPLPERVEAPDMVAMMVRIDERFDRLKAWQAALVSGDEKSRRDARRIDPVQEAIQLQELVRESIRSPECRDRPMAFRQSFADLEKAIAAWADALPQKDSSPLPEPERAERLAFLLKSAAGRCVSCHRAFRDK